MSAKVKKSLRTSVTIFAFVVLVVPVTTAAPQPLDEDVSGSYILSRARRSPQWQYAKDDASSLRSKIGSSSSSGGSVRFLNPFGSIDSAYDRPYHRPGYGGSSGSGFSGQGSNFGFSLNYGQQNYHHRPHYGGGGSYYDPHYNDYHSQGDYIPTSIMAPSLHLPNPLQANSNNHHQHEPGVLIWVPLSHLQHHVEMEKQLELEQEQQQQQVIQQQQLLQQHQLQQEIEQERMQLEHLITLQHHLELQQHLQQMHHNVPLDNQDAMVVPGGAGGIAGGVLGGVEQFYSPMSAPPLPHNEIIDGAGPTGLVGVPPTTTVHHHQEVILPPTAPELITATQPHHPPPHHQMMISPVEMLLRQHHIWTNDLDGDIILPPPHQEVPIPPETLRQPNPFPEDGVGVEQMIHQVEPLPQAPAHSLKEAEEAAEAMMMMATPSTTTTTTIRPPTVLREVVKKSPPPPTVDNASTVPTDTAALQTPSSTTTTMTPSLSSSSSSSSAQPTVLKEATNDVEVEPSDKDKYQL